MIFEFEHHQKGKRIETVVLSGIHAYTINRSLNAISSGHASVSGVMSAVVEMSGEAFDLSFLEGILIAHRCLDGSVPGKTTITETISACLEFVGAASGTGTANGVLVRYRLIDVESLGGIGSLGEVGFSIFRSPTLTIRVGLPVPVQIRTATVVVNNSAELGQAQRTSAMAVGSPRHMNI